MKLYKGIAGAPGIVCADVIYFEKQTGEKQNISIDEARERAIAKVQKLYEKALAELGEDKAKIFSAYQMLLEDEMLIAPIKAAIEQGTEPEEAVHTTTETMASKLASKSNEYLRRRADDIRYIGEMLTDILNGKDTEFSFPEGNKKYILAAHELTPVDTMMFDSSRLAGMICELGGATSHTVILAKSLGIPAVVGVSGLKEADRAENAYLDGYTGTFVVSPDRETEEEYIKKVRDEAELIKKLDEIRQSEARTADGERIAVCINIGKPLDMKDTENEKIDGVGLFRSEFLYSSSAKKPTFEEQTEAYRTVIKKAYPNSVTIRTLDIGGDKQLEYLNMKKEENPFLGNRGIRLCLSNKDIFEEQLRAILIAAAGEKVKIMLPMVTCISEIKRTKELLREICEKLDEEKTEYCKDAAVGIMIETPASAIMAADFAKHSDFFSIGTNDLVQYIMAADRGNADVEKLYNPYHPAVMRMLKNVINAGASADIEVSVCGDLAANTAFTKVLLGMGLKKFSVPLPMVSRIKYKISTVNLKDAEILAEKVLNAESEAEIEKLIKGE